MNHGKNIGKGEPAEDQFMKISDFSESKSSNQNNSEVEEYPIEQFENYVNQHKAKLNKSEKYYVQKINELQKECHKYYRNCDFLSKNIEQLQSQHEQNEQAALNLDQVHAVLDWLEQQIAVYKQQLRNYRQKQVTWGNMKNQELQQLRKTVEIIKDERDNLLKSKQELQQKNIDLQNQNSSLFSQIQSLQNELKDLKSVKNYSRVKISHRTHFDDEIQAQLEVLIQKLMGELQVERNNNRKSVYEIKRMQQQILQLEREVVSKNNKIYSLEMNSIKAKKQAPGSPSKIYSFQRNKSDRQLYKSYEKKENLKSKSDRHNFLKNIYLEEIFQGNPKIHEKERYIIAIKVTSFYMRKYENSDYQPYNPDQLLVCNYNKTNPSLITIKKDPQALPYEGELTANILSWNLGILLSKLLIQPTYQSQFTDESIQLLDKSIDRFIHEDKPTTKSVKQLKSLLDEIYRSLQ